MTDKLRMWLSLRKQGGIACTRQRCRVATGLIAFLFLAALVFFVHQSWAVRTVYWTLRRLAAAVMG